MTLRVCSVDYLNSAPLVWGLLHGPQRGRFDLAFEIPSVLAAKLEAGEADIGNIPVIECARQGLTRVPGLGVACEGAVRSILLISRVPLSEIQTLAADVSSRTSVALTRIVLARRYGTRPLVTRMRPTLTDMLARADAALVIGDPALRLDPATLPYLVADLGEEWLQLTGLPMVFAVWAGPQAVITPEAVQTLRDSYRYGAERIAEIADIDGKARGIPRLLALEYLTRHIRNEVGEREEQGLAEYLRLAAEEGLLHPPPAAVGRL